MPLPHLSLRPRRSERLLLRGLAGARGQWLLTCAGHNLRKLFTHGGLGTELTPIAVG